jgi:hypothetical protein
MLVDDELRQDVRNGLIDLDRLLDLVQASHREQQLRIEALEKENAELRQRLGNAPTVKLDEPFSVRAEEQRQQARGLKKRKESKKHRRGRLANEEKLQRAERIEDVYPEGVDPKRCRFSHVRLVWRLRHGRATLLGYRIYRGPQKQYGVIPGVLGRSEFGLEVVVTLAYLVHSMGLSFDKACAVMLFLQQLKLSKSQADALLHQLARHWAEEFEVLCTLLANSLLVHADETSWSLNSVWALLSEKARLLLFGVHKDAATLKALLDPETFAGLVFSDDAAVYANFSNAQKCWAHLLRKAIKLTLQAPEQEAYRRFTDALLHIYREANRIQHDQRWSAAGRQRQVDALTDQLLELCRPISWAAKASEGLDHDWHLLAAELMRLALKNQLFTFVTAEAVEQPNGRSVPIGSTNNEAERTLREPAQARKTERTSKTLVGARRTSILKSVLESLRLYVPRYTLPQVLEELQRWQQTGRSCFRALLEKLNVVQPDHSVLDQIYPVPDG